jgi:ribosomal protein S21
VAEAGILQELRERQFYEKPGEKKRRKQRQAELHRKYAEAAEKDPKPRRTINKDQRRKNEE